MKEYFQKLIQFEYWGNKMLLASLREAEAKGGLDERAQLLFSHLLSSGGILLQRIAEVAVTVPLFAERSLDECEALMAKNLADWQGYLNAADEAELNREYRFVFPIDGTTRTMSVADGITHFITHSAYHRGQIIARLKGTIDPLPLITYLPFVAKIVEQDIAVTP